MNQRRPFHRARVLQFSILRRNRIGLAQRTSSHRRHSTNLRRRQQPVSNFFPVLFRTQNRRHLIRRIVGAIMRAMNSRNTSHRRDRRLSRQFRNGYRRRTAIIFNNIRITHTRSSNRRHRRRQSSRHHILYTHTRNIKTNTSRRISTRSSTFRLRNSMKRRTSRTSRHSRRNRQLQFTMAHNGRINSKNSILLFTSRRRFLRGPQHTRRRRSQPRMSQRR